MRTTGRERIAQELGEQRQRLGALQDQMRDTIQEAEQTEPLLSERLYDAAGLPPLAQAATSRTDQVSDRERMSETPAVVGSNAR